MTFILLFLFYLVLLNNITSYKSSRKIEYVSKQYKPKQEVVLRNKYGEVIKTYRYDVNN